jgi:hypothetical protein
MPRLLKNPAGSTKFLDTVPEFIYIIRIHYMYTLYVYITVAYPGKMVDAENTDLPNKKRAQGFKDPC